MQFDEALKALIGEGAIRVYQLSDNLAYVYRLDEGRFEARGLYAKEGQWHLGQRLVSVKDYSDQGGWHSVAYLPWQAKAIDDEDARQNPGYGIALKHQCYTCKQMRGMDQFSRLGRQAPQDREWECDSCYERRARELFHFEASGAQRSGDALDKDTISSPPPPSSQA